MLKTNRINKSNKQLKKLTAKEDVYLLQANAVSALDVSLDDFRRLCIFKGIYPQELPTASKIRFKRDPKLPMTGYHRKDIEFLKREPLLKFFKEQKTFSKKLGKAVHKGDLRQAVKIDKNRPRYTLDHLIKERYPTFADALNDLDDALSLVFLFANMPTIDGISHRTVAECMRLSNEWMAYVARERLLEKIFVSVKGIYYQAELKGQVIRWLVPFKFPQEIPNKVDINIMVAFVEFYSTLLQFVLFKLYSESGLVYPPPIDTKKGNGTDGISSYVLQTTQDRKFAISATHATDADVQDTVLSFGKAHEADEKNSKHNIEDAGGSENDSDQENALDKFEAEDGDGDELAQPKGCKKRNLFEGLVFFVGREVPLEVMEFAITAFGGKIKSELRMDHVMDFENTDFDGASKLMDLNSITHQITDRPTIQNKRPDCICIQPQWIFDCINKMTLLPHAPYAPGELLPPHLSPWGDAGGYEVESDLSENKSDAEESEQAFEANSSDSEDVDETQKELELEAAGIPYSETANKQEGANKKPGKRRQKSQTSDDDLELRKAFMSTKERKLYDELKSKQEKEKARLENLRRKRRRLEKAKRT